MNNSEYFQAEYEHDSYFGQCSVCGQWQDFVRAARSIRETYRCQVCSASLREREQAQSILGCFSDLKANTLQEIVTLHAFKYLNIYEPGTVGPFRKIFKQLPNYHQSDYYTESDCHKATHILPHQNLEALTYPDQTFDLFITSDILEHVRNPMLALSESYRVLKVGGYHVFTVPLQEPLPEKTVRRVDITKDQDSYILTPHYHGNGKGGRSLVYNDFGRDILQMLREIGFSAFLQAAINNSAQASRIYTVVAKRQ